MDNHYKNVFAFICLLISLITWGMDAFSIVEPCIYCRIQRTTIGLLGIILFFPYCRYILLRYVGNILAFFGAVVASVQHLHGWINLSKANFHFVTLLHMSTFFLSGIALALIIAQTMFLNHTKN
jgi:hypothetical protein